jgi:hypothetical protein
MAGTKHNRITGAGFIAGRVSAHADDGRYTNREPSHSRLPVFSVVGANTGKPES